jgi:proline iminopeptidase
MRVDVDGTQIWYSIEGREGPAIVLLHGGPGGFDHTYFKPDFSRLAAVARVVYVDLPDHGRSDWGPPQEWTFERAGELIHRLCEVLEIRRPIVLGHSFGGLVAIEYAALHPDQQAGVVLQSTFAHFDLDRIVERFRDIGGDEIAGLVRRSYDGDPSVTAEEWERCWRLFGPWVPSGADRKRIRRNEAFNSVGGRLMLEVDLRPRLAEIACPTLVSVGELDPITPPWVAEEMAGLITGGEAELDVIPDAGHFPWRDNPERYWLRLGQFLRRFT